MSDVGRVVWTVSRPALVRPLAVAVALLCFASLFPLRLDQRNFQDLRRTAGLSLPRGVPYLFVSAGDDASAYRFAGYVLHHLTYPRAERAWLILSEGGPRAAHAWRLDAHGRLREPGAEPPVTSAGLAHYLEAGVVVFDDEAARAEAARRMPLLERARRAYVLAPARGATFVWRPPSSEFSIARLSRVTCLVGFVMLLAALLRGAPQAGGRDAARGQGALAAALAVPGAAAALVWGLSASQVVPLRAPGVWPYVLWAAAACALALRAARAEQATPATDGAPETHRDPRAERRTAWALVFLLAFGAAVFVARLDFDEDAHSHWMQMARSYYDLGRHVPERLLGHIHAATYPFGFAEALSLAAWAADLPTDSFFGLDAGTSLALLFYRLGVAALNLAVLALLGLHVASCAPRSRLAPVAPALAVAIFPTLQGQHVAAETLLFPLLAAALLALAIGRRRARPGLAALGLFIAGAATLVKLEGALLLLLCVLPWAFAPAEAARPTRRWTRPAALALACGLLPTLVWRLTLDVANPVYRTPGLASLRASLPLVPVVALACVQVLLKAGVLWLPCAALPLAAARRLARRPAGSAPAALLLVPGSVWVGLVALASIYLFTTLPAAWQIEVSYLRLAFVPLFSALLYGVETLALDRPMEARAAAP